MFLSGTATVIYSASDLSAAAACEWAVLRRLDAKLGRIDAVPGTEDAMLARTAELGDAHELRMLQRLRATRAVVEIDRGNIADIIAGSAESAAARSEAALRDGAEVVFQAAFFDGRFLGYADFIIRSEPDGPADAAGDVGSAGEVPVYEVYDTKLARSAKITALLQLGAYSDQLERIGVATGENVHLMLGDGRTSSHRLQDILPVYRARRARLERLVDERLADTQATPWGDPRYTACGRCDLCEEQVRLHRDVLLVANLRLSQRARLRTSGILSIDDLAARTLPVPGLSNTTLATLQGQARLQIEPPRSGRPLNWEIINPAALAALPAPDAGDVFFDFEGDPLYQEGGDGGASGTGTVDWGLDYLFGLVEPNGTFRTFWAHNHAEERQALTDFLEYVRQRRSRHPGLHIYHYAPYERTHLLTLAARHGVGEEAVDDLLRATVLVDLYPIVRRGLRIGSRSYSLKKLEPLYMGIEEREGVANAADSITEYVRSRTLLAAGQTEAAGQILHDIARYNAYDCRSTLGLRDWLLERADERAADTVAPPVTLHDVTLPVREPDPVYLELSALLAEVPPADRTADQTALALAAAAIDYHRREQKSFWWDHYSRLSAPVDDWADTRDVLVVDSATVHLGWHREGRQTLDRRVLRLTGALAPGSSIKVGQQPFLLYDLPYPPIRRSDAPGARTAHNKATVVDVIDESVFLVEEVLERDAPTHRQLPIALTPGTPPPPGSQVTAISEWGRAVLDAWPDPLPDAALDLLRRTPPRLRGAVGLAQPGESGGGEEGGDGLAVRSAILDTLLELDRSYLAVQGPPGTGKTFVGSRVIADLVVRHGWRIGVVAQSHAAVENMLRAVLAAGIDAGLEPGQVGKKPKKGDEKKSVPWTPLDAKTYGQFTGQPGGWVLGGTAWDFSNADRVPRGSLDLLVIDEAGQFSLASTIAAAVAAQRLLLLGDPQQLPQVSQGTHPEPVDGSALGWLSDGHQVLPPKFGYFLKTSWRMHPSVCAPVSALSYEGRLLSHPSDRFIAGVEPGLHPVPVPHSMNSTSSMEETETVVSLVRGLLSRPFTSGGRTRPLDQGDVIVVAPYNAQVELLRMHLGQAGLSEVPVGTVDKFQGKEAAVAVISLAASSAQEVPRGLEFLLLANRLNVAISRAQWAAWLVYSPALTETLPTSVEGLAQLSAFITLVMSDPA
ncbi:TM0106 family RecB-like putative nuclease [Cryobacterium breve]|uniref:TM0106 family RecB-like putative nuclease n=1 Tax=Cryobacterium breve TaxID=1259258 RepID=A0ABY2IV12_9MICO|nr:MULTISPECIES: TM0106 family RecB-like putative nuclease [Cryobacterium]TFC94684.1 TM0106 family RecB-like putative nuclease [Cryobacterium sp. TmT3-12]TFC95461.1 TM0106 family RecB-like putative nuclease [Cryobacterium breve]